MKKRILFFGMLAAGFMFTACSSDDATLQKASKQEACTFRLTLPSRIEMDTRGVEEMTADGTAIDVDYNDLTCYLNYSASRLRYNWAPTEEYGLTMVFDQLTAVPNTVTVVSNAITYINMSEGAITDGQNIAEPTDFLMNLPIASQNMNVVTMKAETDVDLQTLDDVTLFGTAPVEADATTTVDTDYTSDITLGALVARFELGNILPGTGLTDIHVDSVFVNNFYTMSSLEAGTDDMNWFFYDSSDFRTLGLAAYATVDFDWASIVGDDAVTEGEKCYAFQLFAAMENMDSETSQGTMVPHFIFEVSGQLMPGYALTDGFTGDDNGNFSNYFVTVDGLIVDEVELTSIARQKVYQVADFSVTPEEITPDPEMPKLNLTVTCTAAPWGIVTATPVVQ